MTDEKNDPQPSTGIVNYWFYGVTLLTAGGLSLVNTNEDDWFGVLGLVLIGSACYCLGVAAVARGIQLSRK